MLNNNFLALIVTFAVALIFLRLNDYMAHRGWISSHLSRKIIHIGTGPLFVLCWLLFTPSIYSDSWLLWCHYRSPAVCSGRAWNYKNQAAVEAMSRSGDRRESCADRCIMGLYLC